MKHFALAVLSDHKINVISVYGDGYERTGVAVMLSLHFASAEVGPQ